MALHGKLWPFETCQGAVRRNEKLNAAYSQIVKSVMIGNIFDINSNHLGF